MFTWLTKLLVGGGISAIASPIKQITDKIVGLEEARLKATTDSEVLKYKNQIDALKAQRDVLVAEQKYGDRTSSKMRVLIAMGPTLFLLKVFVWDLALPFTPEWTHTDLEAIPANLWNIVWITLGFYLAVDVTNHYLKSK